MKTRSIFENYRLGPIALKNRIVMPPMTRARAGQGNVATSMMAEYYSQRAGAGLQITEGTQVSAAGQGYAWTPGLHTAEQVAGWRQVTRAVHRSGGIIFAQLWHVGRLSHTSFQPGGAAPVSSSALLAPGVQVFIDPEGLGAAANEGRRVQHSMPRALETAEIPEVTAEFVQAAANAVEAGFDGVEIHAANGYLINQFLDSESNRRTDAYGGSLQNRLRFLKEVTLAVAARVGKDRVGVRLSPLTTLNGTVDANPQETYLAAAAMLNDLGIAYLHIAEADWDDAPDMPLVFRNGIRRNFTGTIIYSGHYNLDKAQQALDAGWADLIGFGRPFIANPDLPARLAGNWPLAEPDPLTFFGGDERGYTDYPAHSGSMVVQSPRKTALVVGAGGVIGRNLVQHLQTLPGWDVIGITRRAMQETDGVKYLAVDLLDAENVARHRDHFRAVTHVFYAAYQDRPGWAELVAPNLAMLHNVLDAVTTAAPGLQHVSLMQGYKVYGAHLGAFPTPARETDAAPMPPEFNYAQQQLLDLRQQGQSWNWSAIRPSVVGGNALNNPMNLVLLIAVYASVSKELGLPLRFPGKPGAYHALFEMTDAGLLARGTVWAAERQNAGNQAYNITNGDLFRWNWLWPRIAAWFGMETGAPLQMSLQAMMADKKTLWSQMQEKFGLLKHDYNQLFSWAFGDFVFSWDYDFLADGSKARRAGFHEYVDTEQMFFSLFQSFRDEKIIP